MSENKDNLTPEEIQAKLKKIGELLKKSPPRSTQYKRLMSELDRLLGTEEKPRDRGIEEAWEKSRK